LMKQWGRSVGGVWAGAAMLSPPYVALGTWAQAELVAGKRNRNCGFLYRNYGFCRITIPSLYLRPLPPGWLLQISSLGYVC